MNKYKIVGFFNILFGLIYFIVPVSYLFLVVPKLYQIYSYFNSKPNLFIIYLFGGIPIVISLLSLLIGVRIFSKDEKVREKYFVYGLIFFGLLWIISGLIIASLSFSVLYPLYNLSSQLYSNSYK